MAALEIDTRRFGRPSLRTHRTAVDMTTWHGMSKWLWGVVGFACLASATLWQPPFGRELTVCGLVALVVAGGIYFREREERR